MYEQIRDQQRRDPGLLRYTEPGRLELRVFPLEPGEIRTTEIQFTSPVHGSRSWGLLHQPHNPTIKPHVLSDPHATKPSDRFLEAKTCGGESFVFAYPHTQGPEPLAQSPYIHFIIDRSVETKKYKPEEIRSMVKQTLSEFPGVTEARVTLANFEGLCLSPQPIPTSGLESLLRDKLSSFPVHGGFDAPRALKEEIESYEASLQKSDPATFRSHPIFVMLTEHNHPLPMDDTLSELTRDSLYPVFKKSFQSGSPLTVLLPSPEGEPSALKGRIPPLHLVARGNSLKRLPKLPPGSDRSFRVMFDDHSTEPLEIYDPVKKTFVPARSEPIVNPAYLDGLRTWGMQIRQFLTPALIEKNLPALVDLSRQTGVLVPSTSYIVVENSAQWKMLAMKEKQKLDGHHELEFQESPEPSAMILSVLILVCLGLRERHRQKNTLRKAPPLR